MTPQEQGMLDGLIGRVQNTSLAGKDSEAEQRIQGALGSNPDALYILCQTVLVQGYALEQATQQLQAAKQQLAQAQQGQGSHPGFLEKIFGGSHTDAPAAPQGYGGGIPAQQGTYGGPVYTAPGYPPQSMPPQGYPAAGPMYGGYAAGPGYGQPSGGFGSGGFLQGALQTAAGVAMGEIAVQSIEGLVRGFGREAGYGSDRALGGFDGGRDFADNSGAQADLGSGSSYGDRLANADGVQSGLSDDIEDRRGEGRGFFGGGDDGNSGSGFTDSGDDSGSQQDDFSGGDDGGSDSGSGSDDSY